MTTLYLFQVACAALGMVLGFLIWSVFHARKRAAAAEARLAAVELWASGASPVIMAVVSCIGHEMVQEHIENAKSVTKH
jgi:cbb3-type cytochrome oxidase subunit 3